jgi:hypothetical protein
MKCIYCKKTAYNKLDPIVELLGQKIHQSCYGILVETGIQFLKECRKIVMGRKS